MSSISGSDNNRSNQNLTRVRNENSKKLSEQEKQHAEQIRRINRNHADEINKLQEAHAESLSQLRDRMSRVLTDRDRKHQHNIDQVREMYKEQMVNRVGEAERRKQAAEQGMQARMHNQKQASELMLNRTKENYQTELDKREREFSHRFEQMRDEVKNSRENQRVNLTEKHNEAENLMRDHYGRRIASLNSDLSETRQHSQRKQNELQQQKESEILRLKSAHQNERDMERRAHNLTIEANQEAFQHSRKQIQEKYQKALDAHAENQKESFGNLKSTVNERVDRQIHSLKAEVSNLKQTNVLNETKLKARSDRERENLSADYQVKIEELENRRRLAVQDANDKNTSQINHIIREKDKHFRNVVGTQKRESSLREIQRKDERDAMEQIHDQRVEHITDRADKRVNELLTTQNNEQARLQRYYQDNLELKEKNYHESLDKIRLQAIEERNHLRRQMASRIREVEKDSQKKLNSAVAHYETEINNLKDVHNQQLNEQKNHYETRLAERQKSLEFENQRHKAHLDNRVEKIQETHKRELATLQQRHQEQMESLIRQQKFASRKITT